jgi:hypothetical protein
VCELRRTAIGQAEQRQTLPILLERYFQPNEFSVRRVDIDEQLPSLTDELRRLRDHDDGACRTTCEIPSGTDAAAEQYDEDD